jgi:hypothetical protein
MQEVTGSSPVSPTIPLTRPVLPGQRRVPRWRLRGERRHHLAGFSHGRAGHNVPDVGVVPRCGTSFCAPRETHGTLPATLHRLVDPGDALGRAIAPDTPDGPARTPDGSALRVDGVVRRPRYLFARVLADQGSVAPTSDENASNGTRPSPTASESRADAANPVAGADERTTRERPVNRPGIRPLARPRERPPSD